MSAVVPPCRTVEVSAFRGDRSRTFARTVLDALNDERHGRGAGPTALDCLLLTGHAGVSTDGNVTVSGFNPTPGLLPMWRLMDGLRNGDAFPGVVLNDVAVFSTARQRGLMVSSFGIVLPEPGFLDFLARLDAERRGSQYSYGFPNGNGDCNCLTWLERIGLPLLTGRVDEFFGLSGVTASLSRRFGECV
jgi:hypothetical protein